MPVHADPVRRTLPPRSKVDLLASKVGAPPDLVSRAAMAMQQCLTAAAAEEGHTFLPWHRLEQDCGRVLRDGALQHGSPWEHPQALHLVAQHMHASGALVAEPAAASAAAQQQAGEAALLALPGGAAAGHGARVAAQETAAPVPPPSPAVEAPAPPPVPLRLHPTFASSVELRDYLGSKLKGGPPGQPGWRGQCNAVCRQLLSQPWLHARDCRLGMLPAPAPPCPGHAVALLEPAATPDKCRLPHL